MLSITTDEQLPEIPNKRYFTIGEVSELCLVKSHVLRYWEQEFPMLKPVKRRGNRRYYQRQDVDLIRQIRHLLYRQGFTIPGARSQLDGSPVEASKTISPTANAAVVGDLSEQIANMVSDLEQVAALLSTDR